MAIGERGARFGIVLDRPRMRSGVLDRSNRGREEEAVMPLRDAGVGPVIGSAYERRMTEAVEEPHVCAPRWPRRPARTVPRQAEPRGAYG